MGGGPNYLCQPNEDAVPDKNRGNSCSTGGTNPINLGIGNKFQIERDYEAVGASPLKFHRFYNSLPFAFAGAPILPVAPRVGERWSHTYGALVALNPTPGATTAIVIRPEGQALYFALQGTNTWVPDSDVQDKLVRVLDTNGNPTGWQLSRCGDAVVEDFDAAGKLTRIREASGVESQMVYSDVTTPPEVAPIPGLLIAVVDSFGRTLELHYDSGQRLSKLTTPDGSEFIYAYDLAGNLMKVVAPGAGTRDYLYENAQFTNALTGIIDENANRASPTYRTDPSTPRYATFEYDSLGRATASKHFGGAGANTVTYQPNGTVDVLDSLGTTRSFGFATVLGVAKGTSISQQCANCPRGSTKAATVDAQGNVTSTTDFNDNKTCFHYLSGRNLEDVRVEGLPVSAVCDDVLGAQVLQATSRKISTQWHPVWNIRQRIAEPRRITSFDYHGDTGVSCAPLGASTALACKRSIEETPDATGVGGFQAIPSGSSRIWTYSYNAAGQVLTVNGPRTDVNDVTTYVYRDSNHPQGDYRLGDLYTITQTIDATRALTTEFRKYDAAGRVLEMADSNGLVTQLSYSPRGWLTSRRLVKTNEIDETTQYGYDSTGQLTLLTQPDGSWLLFSYDDAHRLIGIDDNLGNAIDYTVIDNMGNRREEKTFDASNALKRKVQREFDALGRLSKVIADNGAFTAYAHDAMGNTATITPPTSLSRPVTTNAFDALNRLRQVTDAASGIVKYEFDGLDQLTKVTDPRNLDTKYTVDGLGNQSKLESPDTGTTNFGQIDEAGNLKSATDANGKVVSYTYDALNRVTSAAWADRTIAYIYDQGANGLGRLTRIEEGTDHTDFTFDAVGRLTSDARTVAGLTLTVGYHHDAAGRLDQVTYPSGRIVTHTFDGLGRVSSVKVNAANRTTTLVSGVTYQPFGGLMGFTFGTGSGTYSRPLDLDGRVWKYTLGSATFEISYDDASNITRIRNTADASTDRNFGYDHLDRLTSFTTTPASLNQSFEYDATGNRWKKIWNGVTTLSTVASASNKLDDVGGVPRTHDLAGNQTGDGAHVFTYDDRGRLKEVTTVQGTVTYTVNALGQRVRKLTGTVATFFAYDREGHLIGEYDALGKPLREIVWLADTPVAVLSAQTVQAGVNFDMEGDASPDLIFRNTQTGETGGWLLHPNLSMRSEFGWGVVDPSWDLDGVVDFNRDGKLDVLWRDSVSGYGGVWFLNGTVPVSSAPFMLPSDMNWKVAAFADLNGDGKADMVLRNKTNGATVVWYLDGVTPTGDAVLFVLPLPWTIVGAADFNGDGKADFVLFNPQSLGVGVWYMNGITKIGEAGLFEIPEPGWDAIQVADYNRDGRPDIVLRHQIGVAVIEYMANTEWLGDGGVEFYNVPSLWQQQPVTESLQKNWISSAAKPENRPVPPGFAKPRVRKLSASAMPAFSRPAGFTDYPKPTTSRVPIVAGPPLPSGKARAKTGNGDLFAIYHIHTDHLNSPRLITRPSDRKPVWRWDNVDPFGANAAEEDPSGFGPFSFNLRFPGQYFDGETGLHYNYFRDYDPAIGRYLQSDPIGLQGGINTYAYAYDAPLRFSDPTGENPAAAVRGAWWVGTQIGAAINIGIGLGLGTSLGSALYDACHSNDESEEERKKRNCQALKDSILNTCASLTGRAKFRCFEAANTSYRQCMGYE